MSPGPAYASVTLPEPIVAGNGKPMLVVFEAQQGAVWQALADRAAGIQVADADGMKAAEALVVELHMASKAVEARSVALKAPLTQLGKAIEQVVAGVADPVDSAKRSFQGKIAAFVRQEQARAEKARQEAEAAARIAREAAEKERARLQAEADAKHAAELAAAQAKAEQLRKVKILEISDPAAVPVSVGGIELRPISPAAVRKALDMGLIVPGASVVDGEEVAMARGRA